MRRHPLPKRLFSGGLLAAALTVGLVPAVPGGAAGESIATRSPGFSVDWAPCPSAAT